MSTTTRQKMAELLLPLAKEAGCANCFAQQESLPTELASNLRELEREGCSTFDELDAKKKQQAKADAAAAKKKQAEADAAEANDTKED